MSNDHDPDDDAYATVHGAAVAPCPSGAPGTVRIFWLIAGQTRSSGTYSETAAVDAERTSRLKEISRTFKAAGWTVRRSPRLVEATRPKKPATPPTAPETGARLFKGPAVEQTAELAELLGMPTVLDLDDLATLATLHSNLQAARGSKTASRQYGYAADHLRTARATHAETGKHQDPADRTAIADMAGAYLAAALLHAREADLSAV